MTMVSIIFIIIIRHKHKYILECFSYLPLLCHCYLEHQPRPNGWPARECGIIEPPRRIRQTKQNRITFFLLMFINTPQPAASSTSRSRVRAQSPQKPRTRTRHANIRTRRNSSSFHFNYWNIFCVDAEILEHVCVGTKFARVFFFSFLDVHRRYTAPAVYEKNRMLWRSTSASEWWWICHTRWREDGTALTNAPP